LPRLLPTSLFTNKYMTHHGLKKERFKKQTGFSLIELIVSITVFLIITASIYGLLRIGLLSRNSINNRSETITNARAAVNSVGKDIVNAGLGFSRVGGIVPDGFTKDQLDLEDDNGPQRDLLTGIVAGNNIKGSDLSISGQKNDVVAFASRDLQFNGGNPLTIVDAPISSITNNSNVLKTANGDCSVCKPFDLYLVESKDGKQAVVMATDVPDTNSMVLGRNDPLDINQEVVAGTHDRSILTKCIMGNTTNCIDYSSGVTAKKIFWVSYSVDTDGTLVRTSYGNNTGEPDSKQIQKQPLAYGVQNFQVRYLMQDGTMSDDPSEENKYPMKMNEVVQVEIKATIKGNNDEGSITQTDVINVTSTFSTRNLKYSN
jgi:prepilin-type N-terminal cleavage/methylation domain-containing protein